jgi:acyl carrier protein
MWKECLDVTEVDETSDFLDQGGTSIAAVHLAASIQEHLAVAIDAIEIVEAPVFGQILALVRERRGQ